MNNVMERIDEAVKGNPVLIFTRGTPKFSIDEQSSRSLAIMKEYELPFAYVDLLDDVDTYKNLHRYKDCVKVPQLYIGGKLIGDYDVLMEMHEKGTLKAAFAAAIEEEENKPKEKPKPKPKLKLKPNAK